MNDRTTAGTPDQWLDRRGLITKSYMREHGLGPMTLVRRQIHSIALRDGWRCEYCGAELTVTPTERGTAPQGKRFATRDHVIPVALGGSNAMSNLVLACSPCNRAKGVGMAPR